MANVFAPFGFAVAGRMDGASWSANQRQYKIAYDNTHHLYTGDVCAILSTGLIDTLAPGTTAPVGIFAGCSYISSSQGRRVWSPTFPGGDTLTNGVVDAWVIDDPNVQFIVQTGNSSGSTVLVTQSMIGMNAQYANGTGNQTTGQSGAYLDLHTTPAVTATFPFRIIDLVQDPPGANGTDLTTPYASLMVMWNNEFYRQLTGI